MRIVAVALCLLLAACGGGERRRAPDKDVAATTPPRPPAPPAPPAPIPGNSIVAKDDVLAFGYAWPALPGGEPALGTWLAGDAAAGRREAQDGARDDAAAAKASGFPFSRHSFDKHWAVDGATPALVSLHAELSEFTGGAHPNSGFEPLLWDRVHGRPIRFAALLADPAAARRAIDARYCPALNAQRAKRRGAPVPKGSTDEFDRCPNAALGAVPAGVRDGAFTTLRILLDPYAAGPYAEGSYAIEVPVSAAFVAALRPEWRASFRAG